MQEAASKDQWVVIENVQIPNSGPCGLSVYINHSYSYPTIEMPEVDLKVTIAMQSPNLDRAYMQSGIQIYN